MKRNVLLLMASYGSGHTMAANSMASYYESRGFTIKTIDIVDFLGYFLGKTSQVYYQNICQNYPILWKIIYTLLDTNIMRKIIFSLWYPIYQKKFNQIVSECDPSIMISFFPGWSGFIKKNIIENGKSFHTGIVITDAISLHSIWYLDGEYIDKFFVTDKYSKAIFKTKFLHKKHNIVVSFFSIESKYFINKETLKNKSIYILLTGLDKDFILRFLESISHEFIQVHIIKGRNQEIYDIVSEGYKAYPFFVFHDTLEIKDHLNEIDIFVGKAGGAVVCECIATDTPVIVPDIIPGQESGNLELLLKSETGIFENDPERVVFYIKYLRWDKFLANFSKVKNKDSCEIIFDEMNK